MSIRKIIAVLLIVGSLILGYIGINIVIDNTSSIEVLDVKIGLSNKSEKQKGYIYLGTAVVLFAGGLFTINKK